MLGYSSFFDSLTVTLVQGREDAPVQGWASQPWRAIPTAIYARSGKGVVTFLFVLAPSAKGAPSPVRHVGRAAADAARIVFADGHVIVITPSDTAGALIQREPAAGKQ